jgi:hypothetical protein
MMPLPECSVLWLTSRGEQGIDAVDARHGLRANGKLKATRYHLL